MALETRKKPVQARAQASFDAILEAAAQVLEAGGRDGFSTNAIALRAGVSIGTLYQYFPNKQSILTELERHKRQRLKQSIAAVCADDHPRSAKDRLAALVQAALAHQFARPVLAMELERAEAALSLDGETNQLSQDIAAMVLQAIRQLYPTATLTETMDVVTICKALAARAALSGEGDTADVQRRILQAALGYLTEACGPR